MLDRLFKLDGIFALEQQQGLGVFGVVEWRAFYRIPRRDDTGLSTTPYESVTAPTPAEAYRLAQSRLVAIKLTALATQ